VDVTDNTARFRQLGGRLFQRHTFYQRRDALTQTHQFGFRLVVGY
jgi:hypothetical protein